MKRDLYILGLIVMLSGCCIDLEPDQISITPVPVFEYLSVRPSPGIYTQEEYVEINAWSPLCEANPGCIFLSIDPFPLVEPGDFLTVEDWMERITVMVDGSIVYGIEGSQEGLVFTTASFGRPIYDPETNEIIAQSPDGSPFTLCYSAPLDVGQHIATVIIVTTSGSQFSYSWPVTIVD